MVFETSAGRREHVRRMLLIPAYVRRVTTAASARVRLIDVSVSGIGFVAETSFKPDEEIMLSFHIPGYDTSTVVMAKVVHTTVLESTGLTRVGTRFLALERQTVNNLEAFIMG